MLWPKPGTGCDRSRMRVDRAAAPTVRASTSRPTTFSAGGGSVKPPGHRRQPGGQGVVRRRPHPTPHPRGQGARGQLRSPASRVRCRRLRPVGARPAWSTPAPAAGPCCPSPSAPVTSWGRDRRRRAATAAHRRRTARPALSTPPSGAARPGRPTTATIAAISPRSVRRWRRPAHRIIGQLSVQSSLATRSKAADRQPTTAVPGSRALLVERGDGACDLECRSTDGRRAAPTRRASA